MTKERIKTAILISLFMVSIFLANQIWIELPESFFPSFADELYYIDSKDIFSDIVSPERYLVNFGNKHTVLYNDNEHELWKEGRDLIVNIFKNNNYISQIIESDELHKHRESLSLDYFFSEKLHIYLISKTLDINIPSSVYNEIEQANNIHISLGKEPFIVFSNGDIHLKISDLENVNKLESEISNIRKTINAIRKESPTEFFAISYAFPEIDNHEFIPTKMKYSLPEIVVKSEIDIDNKYVDSIARNFFDNLEYARPFVEANGSTIYVYNEEVLKIYQDGMLEYSNLNHEPVRNRELYKSLNTAINFITKHLGWPENSYLKSIEPIEFENSKGYRFKFMYKISQAQIMLNEDHSMEAPIEIEVFNDYVKSYKRLVRLNLTPLNINQANDNMLSPTQIIVDNKTNYELIKSKYIQKNKLNEEDIAESQINILSFIDNSYLAYYKTRTKKISSNLGLTLIPVWVIEIDGITFIFDAYEGTKLD